MLFICVVATNKSKKEVNLLFKSRQLKKGEQLTFY